MLSFYFPAPVRWTAKKLEVVRLGVLLCLSQGMGCSGCLALVWRGERGHCGCLAMAWIGDPL